MTYVFYNSQKSFEAVFKNVDGLPKGAPVTALGVKIGKVVRTKPTKGGIKVTIRITKKSFPIPEPGSQLTITSFRPGQGRVLEIIPPDDKNMNETKVWIIQEPITAESWWHASIDILDGLERSSRKIIECVTPENFSKVRTVLKGTSDTLNHTAEHLSSYQEILVSLEENISSHANEGNRLLKEFQGSIQRGIKDSMIGENEQEVKKNFSDFSDKLLSIGNNVNNPKFTKNIKEYKSNIQAYLVDINESLIADSKKIADSDFKKNYNDFNKNISNANSSLDKIKLDDENIKNIKTAAVKAREITTMLADETTQN